MFTSQTATPGVSADRTRGIKARTTTVITQAAVPKIQTTTGMEIIETTSANMAITHAARANIKAKMNIISTRSKTTAPTRKASTVRPTVSISMKPFKKMIKNLQRIKTAPTSKTKITCPRLSLLSPTPSRHADSGISVLSLTLELPDQ